MVAGVEPLNKLGMPERLALALQADGWVWRSTIIWAKAIPMPESVSGTRWEQHRVKVIRSERGKETQPSSAYETPQRDHLNGEINGSATWVPCPGCPACAPNDGLVLRRGSWRPTRSHEVILMLVKGGGYFADQEAVREPNSPVSLKRVKSGWKSEHPSIGSIDTEQMGTRFAPKGGRNPRDVQQFKGQPLSNKYGIDHFAAFPPSLPTWCIRASTSEKGVCPGCGAPWARVVDHKPMVITRSGRNEASGVRIGSSGTMLEPAESRTLGWRATCNHNLEPVSAVVLDPFAGSGSTGIAAMRLGCSFIGIDLSPSYCELADLRIVAEGFTEPQTGKVALKAKQE